jgi:tetratricopeptide (TPR) repeat protein
VGLSATAQAQSGPPTDAESSPAISDRARALYMEGIKAADAKNWSAAHAAFLEAYKQSDHYQIAANLGSMEVKLGRYRDAAEHLAIYLRKAPQDKVKDRMRALAFFDEAKKKVGTVQVRVNVNGAEILVDDKVVTLSPPVDDIFVEPGPRFIKARMAGHKSSETTIEASPGSTHQVALQLEKMGSTTAAPPPPPPKPAPPPPPGPEPFKPKKELIIAGIAVGAVGILGGTIGAIVSSGYASSADERADLLRTSAGPNACAGGQNASECETLHGLRSSRDASANFAAWSFIIGGLAGAGTAVYALVLPRVTTSRPSEPDAAEPSAGSKPTARVVPAVTPSGAGVFVTGAF